MPRRTSARQLILNYYQELLGVWVHNRTLREITGRNDVPRTIRTLRQQGWEIEVRGDGFSRLVSPEKGPALGLREAISDRVRYLVFSRDNYTCTACGAKAREGADLVVDHMVPVNWGGTSEMSNLQTLCTRCNRGKQAWVSDMPREQMSYIMSQSTVERRIEALFDSFPNEEILSSTIRMVSGGAMDWQRALRRIRQNTGKSIVPAKGRNGYIYRLEK